VKDSQAFFFIMLLKASNSLSFARKFFKSAILLENFLGLL
jgi:hypothetical protein